MEFLSPVGRLLFVYRTGRTTRHFRPLYFRGGSAMGSPVLPSVPHAKDGNGRRLFRIRWQDFVMQFVAACEAHAAMHFARGRAVISIKFLAQPVKVVQSESFRLVEQRIDDLASSGGIIELPDVPRVLARQRLIAVLRRSEHPLHIPRDYVESGRKRLHSKPEVWEVCAYTVRNTVMSRGL
jgi:hypothetical protein